MATGQPLSLVGNGRERGVEPDQKYDTFIHMQLPPSTAGVHTEGQYAIVLPNAQYQVTVGVGDPSFINSHHVIRIEGAQVLDFTPSSSDHFDQVTTFVSVTDGKMVVDARGGSNTKISFLEIVPVGGAFKIATTLAGAGVERPVLHGTAQLRLRTRVQSPVPTLVKPAGGRLRAATRLVGTGLVGTPGTFRVATRLQGVGSLVGAGNGQFRARTRLQGVGVLVRPGSAVLMARLRLTGSPVAIRFAQGAFGVTAQLQAVQANSTIGAQGRLFAISRLTGFGIPAPVADGSFSARASLTGEAHLLQDTAELGQFVTRVTLSSPPAVLVHPAVAELRARTWIASGVPKLLQPGPLSQFATSAKLVATPDLVLPSTAQLRAKISLVATPTEVLLARGQFRNRGRLAASTTLVQPTSAGMGTRTWMVATGRVPGAVAGGTNKPKVAPATVVQTEVGRAW